MSNDNGTKGTKYISHGALPILHNHDFAEVSNHYGFSNYRGVLIWWDEDYDPRILRFVDQMADADRQSLLGAMETEGNVYLLWDRLIPHRYGEGQEIEVLRDVWTIHFSENLNQDTETY